MTTVEKCESTRPGRRRVEWAWFAGAGAATVIPAGLLWGPWAGILVAATFLGGFEWGVWRARTTAEAHTTTQHRGSNPEVEAPSSSPDLDALARVRQSELTLARRLDESEAARHEAESMSRAKSGFLSQVSHEIRTPMVGIVGMADLLGESELTPDQRDYTRTIIESGSSLLRILDDIQDYSRIEAETLELDKTEFSLEECVHDVVELLYPRAAAKHLDLTYLIDPGVVDYIRGDAARLRQVLTNLIGNAIRVTRLGRVHVAVTAKGREGELHLLDFRVRDSGPGVAEHERRSIFRPYAQIDGTSFGKDGGTGLGLAISRRLVELMGGTIELESVRGMGSTFMFTLPMEGRHAEGTETEPRFESQRILVVDAHDSSRDVMCALVRRWGIEAAEATSSEEAMQVLRSGAEGGRPFDIAILDHAVPSYGGKDLATSIKNTQELKSIQLVLVRNPGEAAKSSSLVRAGLDAWISKPIGASKLRHALRHLDGQQFDPERSTAVPPDDPLPEASRTGATTQDRAARVLLVEDNVVNQKVATLLLKKKGCVIHVASNGRDALEKVRKEPYDIIFMDCLMPIMSGFEATRAIRNLDANWSKTTPIVAMTAKAMDGDRIQCLEAGMNDYLAKPVQREGLERMLAKWARNQASPIIGDATMNDEHDAVLDPEVVAALRELGGDDDPELFAELVGLFLEDTPRRLQELTEALEQSDAAAVEQAAHALKSSAANLGAFILSDLLRQIEFAGKEGNLNQIEPLVSRTGHEYQKVQDALNAEIA